MRIAICDDYDEYYGSNTSNTASRTYEGLNKVFVSPYFLFLAKYNPCILLPIIEGS